MHEIAHMYTSLQVGKRTCQERINPKAAFVSEEVYGVQACAKLPKDKQLRNANNFAIYGSSASFFLFSLFLPLFSFLRISM